MNRQGFKVVKGFMFAGALAMTAFVGATISGNAQVKADETVETVEFCVEETNSTFPQSNEFDEFTGTLTCYESLQEIVDEMPSDVGYAYINVNGCKSDVLVLATEGVQQIDGKNIASSAYFFTLNPGDDRVTCLGRLNTNGYGLKIKNGNLYAPYNSPDGIEYETYFVSADGGSIVSKDCIVQRPSGNPSGYIRENNTDDIIYFACEGYDDFRSEFLQKYETAGYIEFYLK